MDGANGEGQKKIIYALVVVILILSAALFYATATKKAEAPAALPESGKSVPAKDLAKKPVTANEAQHLSDSGTPAATELKKEDSYAGWLTYTSGKYGYEIKYPSGTKVVEAQKSDFGLPVDSKMTFDQAYAKYTGQICVNFGTKEGSVLVSAPPNKEYNYVICGRTGIGSDAKITHFKDKLMVDGKEYELNVSNIMDSGGSSFETYLSLDDGTQIYFASGSEAGWAEVKKMVESYKKTK